VVSDFQKSKVYDAERAARARLNRTRTPGEGAGQGLDPLMEKEEVLELLDEVVRGESYSPVFIDFIRERQTATYYRATQCIELPPWAMRRTVVLHELAHHHMKCKSRLLFPPHGIEYLEVYLYLLEKYAGEYVARVFREAFERKKVHLTPEVRVVRVRRVAVNAYNSSTPESRPYVELIADDPPARVWGSLAHVDRERIVVGTVEVPLHRCRYIETRVR
jgi:hypothetical protein